MSSSTFRVILRMEIRPGMEEEFERTWLAIGDTVSGHPANLGQWLMRRDAGAGSSAGPAEYFIVSDWVDEPRFREFERSEQHLHHRRKLHPYRLGGEMWTMNGVAFLAGSAAV